MNIILGATGRVGNAVTNCLISHNQPVTAVVRDETKAKHLKEHGVIVKTADYFDADSLKSAFQNGSSVFLLTPENPESQDYLKDTHSILKNYREAVEESDVKTIVCLSSFGAQHASGTGNLEASYMLEHAFEGLDVEKIIVRATYYYSNWIGFFDLARETGVLPTFLPPELKLPMISPVDVGVFIADVMMKRIQTESLIEVVGPKIYSPNDIAEEFGRVLNRSVIASEIPRDVWESTLVESGFSLSGARNLALMTDAVIEGKTCSEGHSQYITTTTFPDYLRQLGL